MEKFKEIIDADFSADLKLLITKAIRTAYDSAIEFHDVDKGSNANTFGLNLYFFCAHELSLLALEKENNTKLLSKRPRFRLRRGNCIIACHKVGDHSEGDIDSSYPNNNNAACELAIANEKQLSFNFSDMQLKINEHNPLNIIIAHMGNPEIGAGAIYIGVPMSVEENGRVSRWAYKDLLWKRDNYEVVLDNIVTDEYPETEIDSAEPTWKIEEDDSDEKSQQKK